MTKFRLSPMLLAAVMYKRPDLFGAGIECSGDQRIDGVAAARTADALYVLLSQAGLRLLRIPLHP